MSSNVYRWYVLGLLTSVFTLNYVDRVLTGLFLEAIKNDLQLSDTQLGLLTGLAFAFFYATLGIPIARWADRGNRVTLTSIAIALWGGAVMLCLFVSNFIQLVGARIAAAVGESGCMPPTYSLVGDYFPGGAERARAMAVYFLANPLAGITGFVVGGWLNELYGWRMTFFLMGLPALAMAVLVRSTVVEPRARLAYALTQNNPTPKISEILQVLWRRRSCRNLIVAIVLFFTMALGLAPWYAAFMIRIHGMGTAELGIWLGGIIGIGGVAGNLLGGYVAGRWFAANERGQMRLTAISIAALVPCFAGFLLAPGKQDALRALVPLVVVTNFFHGPTFALLQRLVANDARAVTLALVMLLSNLIGMGIGPQLVGIFSDLSQHMFGKDSLRYAMLVMSLLAFWSAFHFWRVSRTVNDDLATITDCGTSISADNNDRALKPVIARD